MIGILITMLNLISTAIFVYCLMTFIIPDSSLTNAVRPYAEMLLEPCRNLLYRFFPSMENMALDFSPLVLYGVIKLLTVLLSLLG